MAVADLLVSKALDLLTSVIASEIEQKVKLVVGVEKEVKMLTNNLQSIQAVLIDAEKRQLKEETVKLWLHRLRNISYDIDDVLDEWSTEILKSKIEGDENQCAPKPKRNKVWSFVLSLCFCFREVGFRHDIAVKIEELNENLDVIAKEKDRYNFHSIKADEKVEKIMTTSVVNLTEVKRREEDEEIRNLLLIESEKNPHVISIVGMGGIGKTTLAKVVFNEDSVKEHFDKTIWVCVSDPFDEIRIAKAILESLKGSAPNLVEMQNIVLEIQKYIKEKKFLLVLDDVWNEDNKRWEQVEQFLECGSPGSKILVTTRKENVARIMGCRDIIRLGLLSKEDCWSIFSQVVFSESREEHNRSLEEIGRKIVDKCKGLPLAVKTMAGHLRFKESIGEWQSVLDSELWELDEVARDVLAPLLLSYQDLSSSLKQCFLHCVVFPKDHEMSKKRLIGMWMSQGYLKATQSKDMEIVGEEHFQTLTMRSFFQDFREDSFDNSNMYCKMHDLVHDFAKSSVENSEFRSIEVNDPKALRIDFNNNIEIRHVGVMLGIEVPFPSSFYKLKKLRSLIVLSANDSAIGVAMPYIFNELTCLRSLSFSGCVIREIPSNISKLIHLRQLDLSYNYILEELPETVCKLYNLQTLNVAGCDSLKWLPEEIGKLVNLRCLYNEECYRCLLPKGVGRLSSLRRLSWFNIGEGEAYLSLRDVKNLSHLGGLLRIEWKRQLVRDVEVEEAKEAQLKEKRNLSDLGLCFSDEGEAEWRKQQDEELLEALEPSPTNLKCLEIVNYSGIKICSWMRSLSALKKLVLDNWRNYEQLPPLGKLPFLESLQIIYFQNVKKVGTEFYGIMDDRDEIAFPKLMDLSFWGMMEWEEWDALNKKNNEKVMKIMLSLRSLKLESCPKLKALPHYILQNASLKLHIINCKSLTEFTDRAS